MEKKVALVTGAFGFSGSYIAKLLLEKGYSVRTLTNSVRNHPLRESVQIFPFTFQDPRAMLTAFEGVDFFFNTYWVRFNHRKFSHAGAVKNIKIMFDLAEKAGVKKVIHTSITNPDPNSELEYFRGKGILEEYLTSRNLSYSILRPALLFGKEDILINNIAWALRRFPVFFVFGDGKYRLQPIYVEDFAKLAVREAESEGNSIVQAIGPETFTYRELVETIGEIIGYRRPIVSVPDLAGYLAAKVIGLLKGDVMLTWEEIKGLKADLLFVDAPPAGETKLTDWLRENRDSVGKYYASELARRLDRTKVYTELNK